uniref:Uncharacterized protein n=1 Tax=Pygocentrus nattereri TaxID=42514 RepID=A0A3B4D9L2_PYGNA
MSLDYYSNRCLLCLLRKIHCDVSKHTTNSPSPALERSQHGDFVQFDSAPDTAVVESSVQVNYKCTKACRVGVEVVLSTPRTIGFVSFRRTWTHVTKVGETRTRTIELAFPPALVYKRDFFMRGPMDAHNVMVRAWLVHLDEDGDGSSKVGIGQYHQSLVRTFKFLQVVPLSERPAQPRTRSVAWGAELMWNVTKDRIEQCSPESDVVDLLVFPFASTGEKYGVIRTFSTFINRELETARLRAKEQPRLALSVWLYLLDWCNQKFCAILRHVNEHRKYGAPLIMLKDSGEVVVQMCLVSGEEKAFTAHSLLPLRTWIRLDLFINDSKVMKTEAPLSVIYSRYQNSVLHNDTSGYFVIGGDIYMPGILGYFGPIRYHRLGAEQLLDEAHTECAHHVISGAHCIVSGAHLVVCGDHQMVSGTRHIMLGAYHMVWGAHLIILGAHHIISGSYLIVLGAHDIVSGAHLIVKQQQKKTRPFRGLNGLADLFVCCICAAAWKVMLVFELLDLSCPHSQGHVYSLMGGLRDERLSLLHLGYKHMQGLDGFPKDQDVAYGYYANVGRQTSIDRDKIQDSEQSITEHVRVTNAEELQMQAGEEGDVVQFLRLQAERGHIESQKTLARMLFWGSNGVTKNISEAVKWHARSALEMTDATAMYDYGILLLKGTGVKKNRTLGLKLLQTAADMGAVTALNGLGWYYSTTGKDDRKAVYYFDLAAQNGSKDGVFNLGVYHLNGANPDTPGKNETAAFQCFLKAGQLGHVEGAVEAASSLSRGLLAGVRRDPEKAVMYVIQGFIE